MYIEDEVEFLSKHEVIPDCNIYLCLWKLNASSFGLQSYLRQTPFAMACGIYLFYSFVSSLHIGFNGIKFKADLSKITYEVHRYQQKTCMNNSL